MIIVPVLSSLALSHMVGRWPMDHPQMNYVVLCPYC